MFTLMFENFEFFGAILRKMTMFKVNTTSN